MKGFERQGNSHSPDLNMESLERDLKQLTEHAKSKEDFESILETQIRLVVDHEYGNEDQKNRWRALDEFVGDLKQGYTYDQVVSRRTSTPEHWFAVPLGPLLAQELAHWYRDNQGRE